MDIDYNEKDWATPCPKYDCKKTACKCGLEYVNIPTSLGDDSEGSNVAPKNGAYCNALVFYEANGHVYIYSKEGVPTLIDVDASDISTLEQEVRKAQKDIVEFREDIDRFAYFFDTVADMKASTQLSSGDYARTLGYYSKYDGGGAYYKISASQPSDYYETLGNILYAELIPEGYINIKQIGAIGDGVTDETDKLKMVLEYGATHNIKILFNDNETYFVTKGTTINYPDSLLDIDGRNASIRMNGTTKYRLFNATCETISIKNLKINGDGSDQDQFDQTVYTNLVTLSAPSLTANNIDIENIEMRDMYGSGLRFYNYHNVNINNVLINNVGGHWYQNNTYDAFGDALSFSGHSGVANINISNVNAIGKYKESTLSRIGLAFDFTFNKTDEITSVNVANCNFINYDRGIHVENINGQMLINYNNGRLFNNVFLFNWGNENKQVKFSGDNLILDPNERSYNGARGIYNSVFEIRNSIINCYLKTIGMFSATGMYRNCTFNNLSANMTDNAGIIRIIDSTINLGTLSQYIDYHSDTRFENCVFNSNTAQEEPGTSDAMTFYHCTFNNFIPHYNGGDLGNVFYMTDYSYDDNDKYNLRSATLYEEGVLVATPNMSRTFPVYDMDLYNYCGQRNFGETTTMSLIPTFNNTYLRPNSKYLLISRGDDGATSIRTGRNFDDYYYNVITTDSSSNPTIDTTVVVGNPSSGGRGLSIDEANNTVTKVGTYAYRCVQWLLPYYYKDYLKNM